MAKLLLMVVVLINLSGCAGFYLSTNGDLVADPDLRLTEPHDGLQPAHASEKTNPDGTTTQVLEGERHWCGLTIWAVVPIPLWLPTCRSYREVTYRDGKPIAAATRRPQTYFAACGPFIPFMGIDGKGKGFCRGEFP